MKIEKQESEIQSVKYIKSEMSDKRDDIKINNGV